MILLSVIFSLDARALRRISSVSSREFTCLCDLCSRETRRRALRARGHERDSLLSDRAAGTTVSFIEYKYRRRDVIVIGRHDMAN